MTADESGSRYFDHVAVGDVIEPVRYGPITIMDLVRWCGATENWHRIHYDHDFCRDHEGLPAPLINGSWKQQIFVQVIKDWAGPEGWVRGIRFSFRGMDLVGDALTVQFCVTATVEAGDYGIVSCDLTVVNSRGVTSTVGAATVLLPHRDRGAIAYPFADSDSAQEQAPAPSEAHTGPAEYRRYIGTTSGELVSPEIVEAGAVRRFTQAILADDPDGHVPAREQRYGGIVAPPLFPLYAFHRAAGSPDPLDRGRGDPDYDGAGQTAWSALGLHGIEDAPARILNAGIEIEFFSYAPIGSRIAVTSTYDDIYLKEGKGSPLLFVSTLSKYSVHATGQPLLNARQLIILR